MALYITYIEFYFKVVSRPARSAGQDKKSCFETRESSWVCYEGTVFSYKVLKVYPILLADKLRSSKKKRITHTLRKYGQKKLFNAIIIVVIWSVTPIYYFSYLFYTLKRAWILFSRQFLSLKHSVNLKKGRMGVFQCTIQSCLFQNYGDCRFSCEKWIGPAFKNLSQKC